MVPMAGACVNLTYYFVRHILNMSGKFDGLFCYKLYYLLMISSAVPASVQMIPKSWRYRSEALGLESTLITWIMLIGRPPAPPFGDCQER